MAREGEISARSERSARGKEALSRTSNDCTIVFVMEAEDPLLTSIPVHIMAHIYVGKEIHFAHHTLARVNFSSATAYV